MNNMEWNIGNVKIKNQVVLAPMASVTSESFRLICKEMGAGLVVGEMVSDKALVYDSKKTFDLLKMDDKERPISQQIFGADPETMGASAKIVEDYMYPDIIDINMGCPVPKVAVRAHAGSALMKDKELVYNIVKSVKENVSVPVTVKIRAGWDEKHINAVEIAKVCEEAGASAIFVHARTRSQGYSGESNWSIIKDVVNAVNIPVIGNGDILSCFDAKRMLDETGCTAVMIGRGTLGNPWLIKECVDYLEDGTLPQEVTIEEKIEMMKRITNDLIEEKGERLGVLELRTMLVYFLKGLKNTKELKLKIFKCNTKNELMNAIDEYKDLMENNNEI